MKKKKLTTSKKTKIVGTKELLDRETGELVPFIVEEISDRDFNFHKMWLQNIVTSLDEITNKKMELAFWIIEHLNKENQLTYTQRQISELTGISKDTVNKTMMLLRSGDCPFMVQQNQGCYLINPDILYKGSHSARMGIIMQWNEALNLNNQMNKSNEADLETNENEDK